ncbi:MAG: C13 family peptidase [Gammaproteobacteria bacterium]
MQLFRSLVFLIVSGSSMLGCAGVPGPSAGIGEADLPDGAHYSGGFHGGRLEGQGRLVWRNGDYYAGEFKNGMMHGRGSFKAVDGEDYRGEYREGRMEGQGTYYGRKGERYTGEFKADRFHGIGSYKMPDGREYQGEFKDGVMDGRGVLRYANGSPRYSGRFQGGQLHGEGEFFDKRGGIYSGTFKNDTLIGRGRYTSPDKAKYEGGFKHWKFDGKGRYVYPDGTRYEGGFRNGVYHGQGTLSYVDRDGKTKTLRGLWENGRPPVPAGGVGKQASLNAEAVLYRQPGLVARALSGVRKGQRGVVDLYYLGFAGDGEQRVFKNEVLLAERILARQFGARGRTLVLFSDRQGLNRYPLATVTNLREALKGMAARMDRDEDILFLFVTSHGSKDHRISVQLGELPLQDLPAAELAEMLAEARIKWKVIVVSACYSGGFIAPLRDENSMVITAARADRTSFGCSDEAELTYFGKAFLQESLAATSSFQAAFARAARRVRAMESEQDYTPSEPQIAYRPAILRKLSEWRRATRPPPARRLLSATVH